MNVHEYQGKEILRQYGVATPRGIPSFSVAEADAAARKLGGKVWVVKAQIHAGGRGKGGGVKVAKSAEEVHEAASKILGMTLVTHQTGPNGRVVKRLLVEEGADIRVELYVGIVVDRASQRVTLMASSEGGMEIEEVAARSPQKIHKVGIDPVKGLLDAQADEIAALIGVPQPAMAQARTFMHGLYRAFVESDAALAEVNPLVVTGDDSVLALDAKLNFDPNALFRHSEIVAMRDLDEEDPAEVEAASFGLSYISLNGNIGCLVNGAGLAMATMDTIKLYGAEPELPRCGRWRHDREGDPSVQADDEKPCSRRDPRQHIRRDHALRHDRRGRDCGGQRGETARSSGCSHEGHERGPWQTDAASVGIADHLCRQHSRGRAEDCCCRWWQVADVCMSILIGRDTKVMTQGITGKTGAFHTRLCRDYANGAACFVAGVNPNKAGESFDGIPIDGTVKEAKEHSGATVSVIYVPPPFAASAIDEAVAAGLDLVICITEGVPVRDMIATRERMRGKKTLLVGPNSPGVITPGEIKIGIMPGHIHKRGGVGVVSRSGTLTYEAVGQLSDLGQSTCVGIGGDPVNGLKHIDVMRLFNADPHTDAVIMVGEIGGDDEEICARWIKDHMRKAVVGFIAGVTAPPGKRMRHAGAIISGG
jgi:succinyl-CoA synthetase beta subunit